MITLDILLRLKSKQVDVTAAFIHAYIGEGEIFYVNMTNVYVDDLIFWARNDDDIHDLAMEFLELGIELEKEDDASVFLGVTLEQDLKTGLLEM